MRIEDNDYLRKIVENKEEISMLFLSDHPYILKNNLHHFHIDSCSGQCNIRAIREYYKK